MNATDYDYGELLMVPNTSDTFAARVFSYVEVTAGCWYWTGTLDRHGYGLIGRGQRGKGLMPAHCAVWRLLVGPIPAGMVFDHLCRNHPCVNPEHGEIVTLEENKRRGFGPAMLHARNPLCRQGHPKDGVLGARGGRQHNRYCKTCARAKAAAYHHRMRTVAA